MCVCYKKFDGYTSVYIVPVCSYMESYSVHLVQMMIPLLLCCQQVDEPTKIRMEYGTADETSTPPMKCGCLARLPKHNNRPRCLRIVNSGIHAPHPLDFQGVIIKPPKAPVLHNFEHLKHLGPYRQCSLFI